MVLLGIEIAFLVMGISAIAKGEASLGKGKRLTGTPARLWGLAMAMSFPVACFVGFALGVLSVTQQNEAILSYAPLCDVVAILVSCLIATVIAGRAETEAENDDIPVAAIVTE